MNFIYIVLIISVVWLVLGFCRYWYFLDNPVPQTEFLWYERIIMAPAVFSGCVIVLLEDFFNGYKDMKDRE